MVVSVLPPFPRVDDRNGQPLQAGKVYFGEANQNPLAAPISVFFDAALSVPAAQPLRTSGGYIVDASNAPTNVYAADDFSMAVYDRNDVLLYTAPSYGFRVFADAITFNDLVVATSINPDAAGGASNGALLTPWSSLVTRDLQAKTARVYSVAQPAAAADLVRQTQLMMPLLATNQTSITTTAAWFNAFNTNTATSTWTATGSYTVRPTVALPSVNCVVLASSIDNAGLGFRSVMARIISTTEIAVRVFEPGGSATDGAFSLAIFGNPAVADPIS